jgi:uncharacterized protein (TIGR02687 family)
MLEKITQIINKLFDQNRVVFWQDDSSEVKDLFEEIELNGVTKLIWDNNEFGIKHTILIKSPTDKFLIYRSSPVPSEEENWLLDLYLAFPVFKSDNASLIIEELNLPNSFLPLVNTYISFFSSKQKIEQFSKIILPTDKEEIFCFKIIATICACEPDLENILFKLFSEFSAEKDTKFNELEKQKLLPFLWQSIKYKYQYSSTNPSLKDFLVNLYLQPLYLLNGQSQLNRDALIFTNHWQESSVNKHSFELISSVLSKELPLDKYIKGKDLNDLLIIDNFSKIDEYILTELTKSLLKDSLTDNQIQSLIQKRSTTFYYKDYISHYSAIKYASMLFNELNGIDLTIKSINEGIELYTDQFYKIDLYYRKFIYYANASGTILNAPLLATKVESAYTNSFLLPINDKWQDKIDNLNDWTSLQVNHQREFYKKNITPFTEKDNRIFVIISDGLRYESGKEFADLLQKEKYYNVSISHMVSSIPSYTQLGMASLLPNKDFTFNNKSDIVFVDGKSSKGTESRTKILQSENIDSIAIKAEDFLNLSPSTDGIEFAKKHKIIYIYNNKIDKTGDVLQTEHEVFDYTEKEFEILTRIVKRITSMNGSNIFITADHGYLYQNQKLDETGFADYPETNNQYRNTRRFAIGTNLDKPRHTKHFTGKELGFADNTEAIFPKSLVRFKKQGAGSRYVHGGTSLQEIIVPLIKINKGKTSDIEFVEISVIKKSSTISSNEFGISFFQDRELSDKILPRTIRAAFYSKDGALISNLINLTFDSTSSDSNARETKVVFHLSSLSAKYNGDDITLKLEDKMPGTEVYHPYNDLTYNLFITFSN